MIKFININREPPYLLFRKKYDQALKAKQKSIEAVCISSYSIKKKEVDSRYVNLKFIDNRDFIFFTNYDSPKSIQFNFHSQISALFFWSDINSQIRIKAKIKKISREKSVEYFKTRSPNKNALAISSKQSKKVSSYEEIKRNYLKTLESEDLMSCPDYWGGFAFTPYSFEFWEGNEFRLNKRNLFIQDGESWSNTILEP